MQERLAELQAIESEPPGLGGFRVAVPVLPLFHRLGEPLRGERVVIEVAGAKAGRAEVGTDRCWFASVGLAPYVSPPVLLAFGPMEADEARRHRISAPWDTREVARLLSGWKISPGEVVAAWSVAAPDDEVFLAEYLARCFGELEEWLTGRLPTGRDVLDVLRTVCAPSSDPADASEHRDRQLRLTTPEARFDQDVDLSDVLLAAFADVDHAVGSPAESSWARTFAALDDLLGDDFHRVAREAGEPPVRRGAARFVSEVLRLEGVT